MKITTIIPTYNNETTIKESIESLENQTVKLDENNSIQNKGETKNNRTTANISPNNIKFEVNI